ncbi:hypothetical protein LEAN103870_05190 [Legionella anisa]|uniref:Uncharacterized protein n=1 Tax=Legionella anisa TaxID=28082 RepID=A0AAX0WT01_9GAMM|nr:hypothetical protein [Legionella anisa]AWN73168.1 hypothetical protein DLD14_04550 [Legionella anisa]KTC67395.1 hypothetical protein Lani_3740 [Legionella anisa]MBN5937630.1 hypothetical protein [Legionella anisa]MCW8424000.1 hypothetical protein [Legionella anisa]MCW8447522.1 hypothetical protein [Legionella anisa]
MMKTEILFKFAVIRNPEVEESKPGRTINFESHQWVKRITGLATNNVSLDDARRRVSNDFMDSSTYFLRAPNWQPFLARQAEIQRLLKISENEAQFKSFFNPLLIQINSSFNSLEHFVGSKEFKQLKEQLWHSYYSNVALITRRAQDRPVLEFWLRFWHFLERLVAGDAFKDLINDFNKWSFAVPNQLVRAVKTEDTKESEQQTGSSSIPVSISNKIAETRKTIAQLQATRAQIVKVFHAKLAEVTEKEESEKTKPIPDSGGSTSTRKAPWMLTAKEIGSDAAKALEHLGISLDTHDATQLSALLERQEAELESEVFKLEYTKRVTLVRGVPVIVRRKDASNDQIKD